MARPPAPPGPPPPHYRPPGSALPTPGFGTPLPSGKTPVPSPAPGGISGVAVVAIALVALLLGGVVGFFAGRAAESGEQTLRSTPLTSPSTPTSRPPGNTVPQAPSGAPPSTDLDPTTIGTIDDPIPFGQAYILGLYEIEVISADRDSASELAAFDSVNAAPPAGRNHVLVKIAVRFNDTDGLGNPASIPFFLTDGAGEWRDYEATCGRIPDDLTESGLLEEGDEAVGNACFTVPSDAVDSLVLGTEGFAGPLHFALPG